jgi:hypothetical protein
MTIFYLYPGLSPLMSARAGKRKPKVEPEHADNIGEKKEHFSPTLSIF